MQSTPAKQPTRLRHESHTARIIRAILLAAIAVIALGITSEATKAETW